MTEKSRYWSPDNSYELVLKVGNLDLTPDLISVNIITSVDLPYQTFILQIFYDPNSLILEDIYGQTPINLTVNLLGTSHFTLESTKFELIYLESNMDLEIQVPIPQDVQKDRKIINITAVSRKSYITMNTFVNSIYSGTTINQVINGLQSQIGTSIKYDPNGRNEDVIDQVLIPPSTLYNNLRYINRTWGLFNGAPAIYCSSDNIVYLKNLTYKMKQTQKFIVYQLALNQDNTDIIESSMDGKHYYTLNNIMTSFKGNSTVALLAPKLRFIVKPKDRLFHIHDIDIENFSKDYGLIAKDDKLFFDKLALSKSKRVSIHKDHTGYELSKTFINSNISQQVAFITDVSVLINGNLKILSLMDVGEAVQIISKVTDKAKIMGKFILASSEIVFRRDKIWETTASLHLMRTNRTTS